MPPRSGPGAGNPEAAPAASSQGRATGPSTSPRARLRWLLPVLVVLLWIGGGGPLGSFAGRLAEVQENDNAAFLPANAEATRVQELRAKFDERDTVPAVIVWEAAGGVSPQIRQAAERQLREISGIDGVVGPLPPPLPSADGRALQAVVPLDATLGDRITDSVGAVRAAVAGTPGATAYVTGPGGVLGDFVEAFAGIDGLLLLVAVAFVVLILLVVYRSPLLPLVVLLTALLALGAASAATYALAARDVLDLNGQSQGILFILVIGAATDYALLLVARFREELREHESRHDAMRVALRQSAAPITASALTVMAGVLCLLVSDLNSNRSLGPVGALGIASALLAALTFLPAVLLLLGRGAFWPFRPHFGSPHPEQHGVWGRVAAMVGRRPRAVWVTTAAVLAAMAAFAPALRADGVAQTDLFLEEVESVRGQAVLAAHFPAGSGSPAIIIARADRAPAVLTAIRDVDGVGDVRPVTLAGSPASAAPRVVDALVQYDATLLAEADSQEAQQTVERLRAAVRAVDGAEARVGGFTAIQLDTARTTTRDRDVIIPLVLLVVFVVLAVLLRAFLAPLLLIATVVLSFAATLGVSALVFDHVAGFPGADPGTPLLGFVFLVALGIDYNIFLMTRVREESQQRGTRAGVLRGLSVTGGVITSAGLVLAATFAALAVIPILFLVQIAFVVAFGVLLDALVVRSLLVPALTYDVGERVWWPSRLAGTRR